MERDYLFEHLYKTITVAVWILLAAAAFLFDSGNSLLVGIIVLGLIIFANSLYLYLNAYVIITDKYIEIDGLPKKRTNVKDIVSVKYFAGDYTIRSERRES